jgi:hypothetical protein
MTDVLIRTRKLDSDTHEREFKATEGEDSHVSQQQVCTSQRTLRTVSE